MSGEASAVAYSKSPSTLSTSDYGEAQERSASVGSDYWESAATRPQEISPIASSSRSLAHSPRLRRQKQPSPSLPATPQLPDFDFYDPTPLSQASSIGSRGYPRQPSVGVDRKGKGRADPEPSASPIIISSRPSSTASSPLPELPLYYPKKTKVDNLPRRTADGARASTSRAPITLNIDSDDSDSPQIIRPPRRSPSTSNSSPLPSLSPGPEPEPEPGPEDEIHPAGRALRHRTAAQLKPYSIENANYTREMLKNGWQGAVVAGPRVIEESAEELARRKLEKERKERDDLGGWLEFEDGQRVRREKEVGMQEMSEESEDGDDILERERRRKRRMEEEVVAGLNGRTVSKKAENHERTSHAVPGPPVVRAAFRKPKRPKSNPPPDLDKREGAPSALPKRKPRLAQRPQASSSLEKPYSSDGDQQRPTTNRRPSRAGSEPLLKSTRKKPHKPPRPYLQQPSNSKARPSKGLHVQRRGPADHLASQLRGIEAPSSSNSEMLDSDRGRDHRGSNEEDDEQDEESEEDEEEEEEQSSDPPPILTLAKLGTSKTRALKSMMPGIFFKKAEADLELMDWERRNGVASGSDYGSGDELDDGASGNEHEARGKQKRGRAKTWRDPKRRDEPLRFDGEAFTDESGEDSAAGQDQDSEEEEGDAVASWLDEFAPRRKAGGDEDIVDRFLKQARQTKPRRRKGNEGGKKRTFDRPDHGGGASKRSKVSRDTTSAVRGDASRKTATSNSVSKPRGSEHHPAISLDTGDALFDYTSLRNPVARGSDALPIERGRAPATQSIGHINPLPAVEADDARTNQVWSTFGKFSHDFDITRLPSGIQLPPLCFLKQSNLLSDLMASSRPSACIPFDIALLPSISPDDLLAVLPSLCDSIFDEISSHQPDSPATLSTAAHETFRFLAKYLSTLAQSQNESVVVNNFLSGMTSQLDRFERRLTSLAEADSDPSPTSRYRTFLISLSWIFVDLATRVVHLGSPHRERFLTNVESLVDRLIYYGPARTMKSLKNYMGDILPEQLTIQDVSVQGWVGLISLAVSAESALHTEFTEELFWRMVVDGVVKSVHSSSQLGMGESVSYTTMMLCVVSQFSASGLSLSTPRLHAYWPAVLRALDSIQPSSIGKTDHAVSSTALARRDRYIWTLFARCLVFATRWNWSIDLRGDLIPRLFDLVNARRLADLTIESNGDFPRFLQNLTETVVVRLNPKTDTAFIIFLKLVYKAATDSSSTASEQEKRRLLTRLFLRLSPMSSGPWTRSSPEIIRSPSVLVNHYSLLTTFAILSPSSAQQRLDQARRLVIFSEVDEHARRTCIRAILYFALNLRHLQLSLTEVSEWLAEVVAKLRTEYLEVEKRNRLDRHGENRRQLTLERQREAANPLWQRAILLTMVLRSVQLVLRSEQGGKGDVSYPDLALLHPAWTSQLLESTLALDPMIGVEALKCIDCFLTIRQSAVPRRANNPPVAGVSQDEFGMFEMDYTDAAFDDLLGGGGGAGPPDSGKEKARLKDLEFSAFVAAKLSPAFFRLLSNIFATDLPARSGPTVSDRLTYAREVVECWVRCLSVRVENGLSEWAPYLRYGDHSWKRISAPVGRREVGLLLVVEMFKYDNSVAEMYYEELLEVWFQSIVARDLSSQHHLTNILLNVAIPSPLFSGSPFERLDETNEFGITALQLKQGRIQLLAAVFRNAARFFKPDVGIYGGTADSAGVLQNLRALVRALSDNLTGASDVETRQTYASFCRQVLEKLKVEGGGRINEQMIPELRNLASAAASVA